MSARTKTSSPITPVLLPATMHAMLAATLLAAVTHSLAIAFHWGGPSWVLARNDLFNLPAGLLATMLCWLVGSHLEPQQRIVWRYFAAGMTSFLVGDLIWTVLEMALKRPPLPSVAGVFYLGLPILFLFGLRALNTEARTRLEALKIALDAVLILIATLIVVWQVFLAQLVVTFGHNLMGLVFGTAMPILELMVVVCLMLPGLGRQNAQPGPHFGLLWIGTLLLLFGNTNLILEGMRQTYQANQPTRLFCTWAFVLFALAAHANLHFRLPAQRFSRSGQFRQLASLFPYTAALVGMIALAQQFGRKDLTALGVLIGNGLVGLLVMVRQAVSLHENGRLNAQLLALNAGLTERVTDRETALEQSKERLIAADRLASLGQLTGGIAHEVNTPLAAMNFLHQANNLSDEYKNSIGAPGVTNADHLEIANELKGNISSAQTTLERLGEFVRSIRNQGRSLGAGSTSYNLVSVVRDTVNMLEFEARKVQVNVRFESSGDSVMIHGEPGRIAQIVQNLVGNAIHACESRRAPGGSVVTVRLARQPTGQTQGMGVPVPSERVVLSVQDNGSGIPPEVLPRIFEPLYSTKEIGRGTGLGLSIIRDIVTGHLGGEINLETNMGQGTTFTVSFPVAHTPQIELAAARHFEPSRNTVVIGED